MLIRGVFLYSLRLCYILRSYYFFAYYIKKCVQVATMQSPRPSKLTRRAFRTRTAVEPLSAAQTRHLEPPLATQTRHSENLFQYKNKKTSFLFKLFIF